jgi:short-subunit dehydrogenase
MPRAIRRKILITGASSGLGAAMAREFVARGRDVALCARRIERLEELKGELTRRSPGVKVAIATLDVNDHHRVPTVFADLSDQLGGVDRVVVNAGIGKAAPLGSGQVWTGMAVLETNAVAGLVQIETALELFTQSGAGHLVLMSSISAAKGLPGVWSPYCASKAALSSLGQSLRAEYARGPIRVSVIEAGPIETEMHPRTDTTMFMMDPARGARALVRAIERERGCCVVPRWPWAPIARILPVVPPWLIGRFV